MSQYLMSIVIGMVTTCPHKHMYPVVLESKCIEIAIYKSKENKISKCT